MRLTMGKKENDKDKSIVEKFYFNLNNKLWNNSLIKIVINETAKTWEPYLFITLIKTDK